MVRKPQRTTPTQREVFDTDGEMMGTRVWTPELIPLDYIPLDPMATRVRALKTNKYWKAGDDLYLIGVYMSGRVMVTRNPGEDGTPIGLFPMDHFVWLNMTFVPDEPDVGLPL